MSMTAWFRPADERSSARYDVFSVIYRDPETGSLLDVEHDLDALKQTSGADWKARFDARTERSPWPHGSGVWSKKEWVLPQIEDDSIVSLLEGNTPLLPVPRLADQLGAGALWVKQCGTTHTGSFKDLGMTVLVSAVRQMRKNGVGIRAIACASTGDTSAALAAYGAAAEIPTIVFLPKGKITAAQLIQPIANGAHVLELDTDFDGCMKIVKEVCEGEGSDIYLANSMNSLRIEGQKTVALEIAQQLGWQVPEWVIIPGGNLGNVSALGAGFDMLFELGLIDSKPRICVAQAEAANPLYLAYQRGFDRLEPVTARPTAASAIRIGDPVSYRRAVRALRRFEGVVEQASESELAEAAARADRTGLFTCPHTAVALAALDKLVKQQLVTKSDRVVVISTAHGLKFTEFKASYHTGNQGALRNPPVTVAASVEAVRRTLDERLGS